MKKILYFCPTCSILKDYYSSLSRLIILFMNIRIKNIKTNIGQGRNFLVSFLSFPALTDIRFKKGAK